MAQLDAVTKIESILDRDLLVLPGRALAGDGSDEEIPGVDIPTGVGVRARRHHERPALASARGRAARSLHLIDDVDRDRFGRVGPAIYGDGGRIDAGISPPDGLISPSKRDALLELPVDDGHALLRTRRTLHEREALGGGRRRCFDAVEVRAAYLDRVVDDLLVADGRLIAQGPHFDLLGRDRPFYTEEADNDRDGDDGSECKHLTNPFRLDGVSRPSPEPPGGAAPPRSAGLAEYAAPLLGSALRHYSVSSGAARAADPRAAHPAAAVAGRPAVNRPAPDLGARRAAAVRPVLRRSRPGSAAARRRSVVVAAAVAA